MIWLVVLLLSHRFANAGQFDPKGHVKAKLFSFEPKVEAIAGIVNCEDELNNLIEGLGHRIAKGSSSKWLGEAGRDAYNETLDSYRKERIEAAGGTLPEREKKLWALIPPPKEYVPGRLETPESRKIEYVHYLADQFTRFEMAAIVQRAIRELEHHYSANRRFKSIGIQALPGDRGRAFRLLLFFSERLPHVEPDYDAAFWLFADAFLTPEIIKQTISVNQIEHTQELFRWLHEHNRFLYFHFLEKYQPFIKEDHLRIEDAHQPN